MPTLEITTMVGCPMQCTFCPQDKLAAAYPAEAVRAMSLDSFQTILSKVPAHVRIDFSGMSEPWINRHATDMLDYAIQKGHHVAVYTTLQGMKDPERVAALLMDNFEVVENIVVHLPDQDGNMRGFRDTDAYRRALEVFRGMDPHVKYMTMAEGDSAVGSVTESWNPNGRAGNLFDRGYRHTSPVTCTYTPFYDQNVVLPNGAVYLCCMDYGLKHFLGNLLYQNYEDLFSSMGMGQLLSSNVRLGGCGESICRKCDRARTHSLSERAHQFWEWDQ